MGKKKLKTTKKTKRKGITEDVRASTSLPPSVDGQLRCFLKVTTNKISWVLTKPPEVFFLRLKWWGEQSSGSLFRPSDGRDVTKSLVRKTARFPIRCGPKQFAEYLNAMGVCVFELVKGAQMTSIGKATVSELGLLSPQNPVSGTYPVFSTQKAEKLADLSVSMKFEPLPVSYDSSSSVPTTDVSLPAPSLQTSDTGSNQPSILKKPRKTSSRHSSSSRQAPSSGNETSSRGKVTPSGVDNEYSFVVGPGAGGYRTMENEVPGRPMHELPLPQRMTGTDTTVSDTATDSIPTPKVASSRVQDRFELPPSSDAGKELISAILEKGNKLMDSMIRVQCELQPKGPNVEEPSSGPQEELAAPVLLRRSSSGDLFRVLLKDGVSPERISSYPGTQEVGKDVLDPALQLVVGDEITDKEMKNLKIESGKSPVDSDVSDVMDVLDTDSDDPLHESSLLEELFYKGLRSSSDSEGLSDILLSSDSDTDLPKRKHLKTRKGKQHRKKHLRDAPIRQSEDAENLKETEMEEEREARDSQADERDSDTHDDSCDTSSVATLLHKSLHGVEGLSVQRLTLLGRIHAAKVSIGVLSLIQTNLGSAASSKSKIPRRISGDVRVKGKPPRPHEKSTYFVEYQFPVTASSRESDYLGTMATEVTRIVSKKVTERNGMVEVQFGHRSVFPIQFDGSTVDHWWTRLLVLRVYHKLAGQKTPSLIAVGRIPLKNIIKSPNLAINADLPIRRKLPESQQTSPTTITTDSTSTSPEEEIPELGKIQISIELASDSKDFKSSLARTKLAEMKGAKLISLPTVKKGHPHYADPKKKDYQASKPNYSISSTPEVMPHKTAPRDEITRLDDVSGQRGEEVLVPHNLEKSPERPVYPDLGQTKEQLTLFTLLLIPEGRGLTVKGKKPLSSTTENQTNLVPVPSNLVSHPTSLQGHRDFVTRNPYLVCKMFWSDDAVHSHVCWGTSEPNFNFSQVAPVLLTPSLLERTRNNFMVVEVWDKKTSGQNDELIGIAKLPLHQFYMSFRDIKIANALLKSQYPLVGIDNYAPVINPFTGVHYGQIKVLLAMGASHQISSLQRLKGDVSLDYSKPERPLHYLERSDEVKRYASLPSNDIQQSPLEVEHIFEVVIEGIRSLPQGEDGVWGEADCFVQYHFPSQDKQYNHLQGSLNLRSFRSATTLCLPDPTFNEVTRHRISLPQNIPVQRELLTAYAGVGGAGSSIPFEVWCRYYYPNVRDQVMAKASLPLAKLCAMVTMQRRGEPSVQTFNLPLRALQEQSEEQEKQIMSGGFLDVTVSYKQSTVKRESSSPTNPLSLSTFPSVTLSVTLYRATGLQAAALALTRYHSDLQYASDVGVNTFATVSLTFLPKEEIKKSRTVARSFSPELSHQVDFTCPLVLHSEGEVGDMMEQEVSLAEVLETADLEVKLWHQVQQNHKDSQGSYTFPGTTGIMSGRQVVAPPSEVLLGSTTVPLKYLLLKRTGLHGWFTVSVPPTDGWATFRTHQDQHTDPTPVSPGNKNFAMYQSTSQREGGSLELTIKFAHKNDREKVIEVGHRMGWSSRVSLDEDEFSDHPPRAVTVTIQIDKIVFHELSFLRPGQTHWEDSCKVYIRYQFYDKRPTCSSLVKARVMHKGEVSVDMRHTQTIQLNMNPSLKWYLQEESLEIQVWVSQGRDQTTKKDSNPRHRDVCIGSAHIDLINLSIEGSRHPRISGLYPLSKPGRDNMYGASLRGSITLQRGHMKSVPSQESVSGSDGESPRFEAVEESDQKINKEEKIPNQEPVSEELEEILDPIPFELHIERAMGLSASPQRWNATPLSSYVTLQVMDCGPLVTPTVTESTRPVWNFYREIILHPNEVVEKQHLIFKIWHQTTSRQDTSCDRMLGFTSVDLGPLLVGFRSLNGWYNITDFSSQVKGQLKIAITPKRDLSTLKKRAAKFMSHMTSLNSSGFLLPLHSSFPAHPLSGESKKTADPPLSAPTPLHRRHHERHRRGVRELHEKLRSLEKQSDGVQDDPSLSLLRENLKKNLADLDSLKEQLDQKRRCLDQTDGVKFVDGSTSTSADPPLNSAQSKMNQMQYYKQREYRETNHVHSGRIPDVRRDESEKQSHDHLVERGRGDDEDGIGDVGVRSGSAPVVHEKDEAVQHEQEEEEDTGGQFGEEDGNRIELLSEGQEDSEDEKGGDIVIPRTLNDVLLEHPEEMESSDNVLEEVTGHDSVHTGDSVGYETPEEALERIQNRIFEVVSRNLRKGGEMENTGVNTDRKEMASAMKTGEEDEVVGEKGLNIGQNVEEDTGSVLSSASSSHEDLASFASSRDECDSEQISERKLPERTVLGSPEEMDDVDANTGTVGVHLESRNEYMGQEVHSEKGETKIGEFEENVNQRQYLEAKMVNAGNETVLPSSAGLVQPLLEPEEKKQEDEKNNIASEDLSSLHSSKQQDEQSPRRSHQTASNPAVLQLPNFFLPRDDLASAMRTLDSAVSGAPHALNKQADTGSLSEKIKAAREVAQRMEKASKEVHPAAKSLHPKKFAKRQPTAEEAKRIAKIFSEKYSPP